MSNSTPTPSSPVKASGSNSDSVFTYTNVAQSGTSVYSNKSKKENEDEPCQYFIPKNSQSTKFHPGTNQTPHIKDNAFHNETLGLAQTCVVAHFGEAEGNSKETRRKSQTVKPPTHSSSSEGSTKSNSEQRIHPVNENLIEVKTADQKQLINHRCEDAHVIVPFHKVPLDAAILRKRHPRRLKRKRPLYIPHAILQDSNDLPHYTCQDRLKLCLMYVADDILAFFLSTITYGVPGPGCEVYFPEFVWSATTTDKREKQEENEDNGGTEEEKKEKRKDKTHEEKVYRALLSTISLGENIIPEDVPITASALKIKGQKEVIEVWRKVRHLRWPSDSEGLPNTGDLYPNHVLSTIPLKQKWDNLLLAITPPTLCEILVDIASANIFNQSYNSPFAKFLTGVIHLAYIISNAENHTLLQSNISQKVINSFVTGGGKTLPESTKLGYTSYTGRLVPTIIAELAPNFQTISEKPSPHANCDTIPDGVMLGLLGSGKQTVAEAKSHAGHGKLETITADVKDSYEKNTLEEHKEKINADRKTAITLPGMAQGIVVTASNMGAAKYGTYVYSDAHNIRIVNMEELTYLFNSRAGLENHLETLLSPDEPQEMDYNYDPIYDSEKKEIGKNKIGNLPRISVFRAKLQTSTQKAEDTKSPEEVDVPSKTT